MDLPVTLGTHLPNTLQLFCPSAQKGGAETELCPQSIAVTSTDIKKCYPLKKKRGETSFAMTLSQFANCSFFLFHRLAPSQRVDLLEAMVHKCVHTADAGMETEPNYTTQERVQHDQDEQYIHRWYERQRLRNWRHRQNRRRRVYEAWERLEMLKEDVNVCNRSAEGKPICPKKMPRPPKRPSPCPDPQHSKHQKTSQLDEIPVSVNPTATSSTVAATEDLKEVSIVLHSLAMPVVEPLQPPQALQWIEKKFPLPRATLLNRVLPKLVTPAFSSFDEKPPYGQVLIEEYRRQQKNLQG